MAKQTANQNSSPKRGRAAERPSKKARTEKESEPSRSKFRIKGSPRPVATQSKGKAKATELESQTHESNPSLLAQSTAKSKLTKIESTSATKPVTLPTSFKVIAGSYEKLLYGLEGRITTTDDAEVDSSPSTSSAPAKYTFSLTPMFIFPAHVSCIKAVAASPEGGKWLATGSADEIVKVWDLRRRKEIGGLMHHEGSITHLTFPSRSHLLSASEDGTLCLFRARDWSVLRALRGHKGPVNSVAVHPSGKVALSVGKDRTLRMWDLMRGKGCASTKIGKEGEIVRWSVDGSLFVVQSGSTIDVYTTDMVLLHTITHPSRLHDVCFCKRVDGSGGEVLFAAAEDKNLSIYDISTDPTKVPKIIAKMTGHGNRVKAVQTLSVALPVSTGRTSTTIVCTVSSDGKIHIYDMATLPSKDKEDVVDIAPAAVYDSKGTRLTCVALADGDVEGVGEVTDAKRKREEEEHEEENADGEGGSDAEEEDEDEGWAGLEEKEEEEEEEEEG
ncbi:p21-activated protein kinase-interacting protein 1-like [Hypsizygus marmoreus]|uniref:P21-activated protein kinase-interacting protein 1-like n=1 Tax=Hypsizygus marmoreus TaxID=39966 RepID=A0A369JCV4_HYPMA|nr:p21-activated protein kinase-interacting protein 1-like [Hypsizygus marmoreus]